MPKRINARSPSITSQGSYSAVIIADLVAEVQQQPEYDHKEETKLNNDSEKEANSPAVVNVECTEAILKSSKLNGSTDISKGVILNAVQFTQTDAVSKLEAGNGAPISSLAPQNEPQKEVDNKSEFSQMSVGRKIAFGISFLPSIMFILCFAIIFPCKKTLPCIEDQWSINFNQTDITSKLLLPQNVVFTFLSETGSGVRSLRESSGELQWEAQLTAPSKFIECGNLAESDQKSCLILDNSGALHLINSSNGKQIWRLDSKEEKETLSSLPAILPDCNDDNVDEIAVAVSKTKIKIIYRGNRIYFVDIPSCDHVPSHLLTWKRQNETDILFTCQKGKYEHLMRIPQSKWCFYGKTKTEKISTLLSTEPGLLSEGKFLPSSQGLFVWLEDDIKMFTKDGELQWASSFSNHSKKNRFLFEGKFNDENQIVLYSSDIGTYLQATILNSETGNITDLKTIPHVEMTEAAIIHGEKRDFILGLKKKLSKSLKNQAISQMSEISASVINMLTKEDISVVTLNDSSTIVEEITLAELNGNDIQTIQSKTFNYLEGESYETTFTASYEETNEDGKLLKTYILRKPRVNPLEKSTTIQSIFTSNWDVSSEKESHCDWK